MLGALYSTSGALNTAWALQEISSFNLAHAGVPGFKRIVVGMEAQQHSLDYVSSQKEAMIGGIRTRVDLSPGSLYHTGNPWDVALKDNRFLVVEHDGQRYLTKKGALTVDSDGQIITRDGFRVAPGINVPASFKEIVINGGGAVIVDGTRAGVVSTVSVNDISEIERVGVTLFKSSAEEARELDANAVASGYLEGSNVNVVEELVTLMSALRFYEAAVKTTQVIEDVLVERLRT